MIHPAALTLLATFLADGLRPAPLPLTPLEFAATLKFRKGRTVFDYDIGSHPAQRIFLEVFGAAVAGESRFRHFVIIKPTQDGGTMVTQAIPQFYVTTQLGDPVIAGNADMRLSSLQWQDKLRPLIVDSGRSSVLPTEGPGSEGATAPTMIKLAGVSLYYLGAGASNEAGQAMVSGRLLTRDELDSMHPYTAELMTGRQDSYPDTWLTIDTSTIKHDESSPILESYEASTAAHLEFGCPYCNRFVHWQWKHVRFDSANVIRARESVHLVCPHDGCGQKINDIDRKAMLVYANCRLVMKGQKVNAAGDIEGPMPETIKWGMIWTALDSPLIPLSRLAEKYVLALDAKKLGDHAPLRRFFRDALCQVYVEEIDNAEISPKALSLQSDKSDYDKRQVPAWAKFITVGMDVQKDRHYWVAIAFDLTGERSGFVDWGYEYVLPKRDDGQPNDRTPTAAERHQCLDRLHAQFARGWQIVGTEDRMVPVRYVMDTGYNRVSEVDLFPWIQTHPQWTSGKGVGRDQMAKMDASTRAGKSLLHPILSQRLLGILDIRQPDTMPLPLLSVSGHTVRQMLHAALMRPAGTAGQCWLPKGLKSNDYLLLHLCAEIWTEEMKDGKPTGKWYWREVRRDQNHLLDSSTYCYAAGVYHREVVKLAEVLAIRDTPPPPPSDHSPSHRPRFERRHSRLR